MIALLGAGSMGTAIVSRIAAGKKILLGDIREKNLAQVSHDLQYSGCDAETMIVKRVNHLQAQKTAAAAWKERRARINPISPGVIVTPLAYDELSAAGDGCQKMIDTSAAERTGTSGEIAEAAAFLLGEHTGFITGADLLIDGGKRFHPVFGEQQNTGFEKTNQTTGMGNGKKAEFLFPSSFVFCGQSACKQKCFAKKHSSHEV